MTSNTTSEKKEYEVDIDEDYELDEEATPSIPPVETSKVQKVEKSELKSKEELYQEILSSFENPKGIEHDPNNKMSDLSKIDTKTLLKDIMKMPKNKLHKLKEQLEAQLKEQANDEIQDHNFRTVDEKFRKNASTRIRTKLQEMKNMRSKKAVNIGQLHKEQKNDKYEEKSEFDPIESDSNISVKTEQTSSAKNESAKTEQTQPIETTTDEKKTKHKKKSKNHKKRNNIKSLKDLKSPSEIEQNNMVN